MITTATPATSTNADRYRALINATVRTRKGATGTIVDVTTDHDGRPVYLVQRDSDAARFTYTQALMRATFRIADQAAARQPGNAGSVNEGHAAADSARRTVHGHEHQAATHDERSAAYAIGKARKEYKAANAALQAAESALKQAQTIEATARQAAEDALAALTALETEQSREREQVADNVPDFLSPLSPAELAMSHAAGDASAPREDARRALPTWQVNDLVLTPKDDVTPSQPRIVVHVDEPHGQVGVKDHAGNLTVYRADALRRWTERTSRLAMSLRAQLGQPATADQAAAIVAQAATPERRQAGQCRHCDAQAVTRARSKQTRRMQQVCTPCASKPDMFTPERAPLAPAKR